MSNQDFLPAFASNRPDLDQTVGGEVSRLLRVLRERLANPPAVALATAYINPSGFGLLADELELAPTVKLLLGAEPLPDAEALSDVLEAERDIRLALALEEHAAWLAAERDSMGFSRPATQQARRMVDWLQSVDAAGEPRVQVKRYTKGFLHGKAYIADDAVLPAVLAGSSNLTYAGLALNAELNLGYPAGDPAYGNRVREWFSHYWDESEPFDLASLYSDQWEPHTPWVVFMRMLFELYADHLEEDDQRRTILNLTQFQSDGVARMMRLLDTLGGVLVADEVGLGKTFLAGEVIARATQERRQQVLIVCPASLKDGMWGPFLKKHDFSRRVEVMSYEELRNKMEKEDNVAFRQMLDDFALVVIDEAHNLRNAGAKRSEAIDQALIGGVRPKQVVLLTATPVNNSLKDLETLIRYFVRDDSQFASIGIPSISGYIKHAQSIDPERLTPEHLFDLMDQVAVRRTRKFVKETYPGEVIVGPNGVEVPIQFPDPEPYRIDYVLDADGQTLLNRMVYALDLPEGVPLAAAYSQRKADPNRLLLARYTPSGYRKNAGLEAYQVSNVGLLRSALLKRLESSPHALMKTLKTLVNAHESFLAGLDQGYVLIGQALRDFVSSESADFEEFLEEMDVEGRKDIDPVSGYHLDELMQDVRDDLTLIIELLELAEQVVSGEDTKAQQLISELTEIASEARKSDPDGLSSSDRRKVLIFSSFSDTIVDLHERVTAALANAGTSPLSDYSGRLGEPVSGTAVTTAAVKAGQRGGVHQEHRAAVIQKFAPDSVGPWDDDGNPYGENAYDILITTDVLAEGVNLQQAGRIINYDLPWNPMRIVQRHGRVDRIGSRHSTVKLGLFYPDGNLDVLLNLEATIERKLAQAEAAIGVGKLLPGRKAGKDVILTDPLEEARKLLDLDLSLLESRGSSAALSGEEYRRRLRTALADPFTASKVSELPFASGSGFRNSRVQGNGYVFCIKMGDHTQPWFRYVPVDENWAVITDEEGQAAVIDDTLTALVAADPRVEDEPRHMTDEIYDCAFDAWDAAKAHAKSAWDLLTDASNLMPSPPKAMRDAFALVLKEGAFLGSDDQRDLVQRLSSVPSTKVERSIRRVLNGEGSTRQIIERLRDTVAEAGLQPAAPVKPLPPVAEAQVRLIAWMAVEGTAIDPALTRHA
jgi:hypothetical protein